MSKVGRPKGSNTERTIYKGIRITPKQEKNWNPDKIRHQLDINFNGKAKISTKRESKDEIIPELTKLLREGKDKIPIELYRSLKLIVKIIEVR